VRDAYKDYEKKKASKQNKTSAPRPPSAIRITQEKFKVSALLRLLEPPLVFGEDILFRFNVDDSTSSEHLVVRNAICNSHYITFEMFIGIKNDFYYF
jgi:hypothetical protein